MSRYAAVALAEAAAPPEAAVSAAPDLELIIGAAEPAVIAGPEQRPNLYVVQDQTDAVAEGRFINAADTPELAAARSRAAEEAAAILSRNRHLLSQGHSDRVPQAADALGTARQVVAIKRRYGEDSAEYQDAFDGLVLDSQRLAAEAATKNEPEHFERALHTFDADKEEYFSHGFSMTAMTKNGGLTPFGNAEEQDRRIGEVIEEVGTFVPIGRMIVANGLHRTAERMRLPVEPDLKLSLEVTTVSMCTDEAEEGYAINPKGSFNGYRPSMKGIAIRRMHYESDNGDREQEQVIIDGTYITIEVIEEELAAREAVQEGRNLTKTQLHRTQLLSVNDGSVMNFVRALDDRAGEKHGKNLFMGKEVPDDHPKDYEAFMEDAVERKHRLTPLPIQVAEYAIKLEEQGIDSQTAGPMVTQFLKKKLFAIAKKRPELAGAMFDEATAEGLAEVKRLEADGHHEEARELESRVREAAPDPEYCGAGSDTKGASGESWLDPNDWHGGEIHYDSKCVSCEETKSEVGACFICKDCVDNPRSSKQRSKDD